MAGNIDQCKGRCLPLWTSFMVTLSVLTEISSQSVQFTSQSNIFLLFHRIPEGIFLEKAQVFFYPARSPNENRVKEIRFGQFVQMVECSFSN